MNTIVLFDFDLCSFYSLDMNYYDFKRGYLSAPLYPSFVNGVYGHPIVERSDLTDILHHRFYEIVGYCV